MNNKVIAIIALVVVLGGGWYLLKNQNSNSGIEINSPTSAQEEGTVTETPTGNNTPDTSSESNVKEFTVTGSNFSFAPSTLTVNKGDTVKITFVNSTGFHDLVIDEFGVSTSRINGGQSASITFVADKSGVFEYYCSVGTHRQMGMKGTLTVI